MWHNVNHHFNRIFIMATKFVITRSNKPSKEGMHYEKASEHRSELARIAAVEKELKHHEAQGMDKAHGGSQKSAPLPNMRSY
jgi:hypothetical protein